MLTMKSHNLVECAWKIKISSLNSSEISLNCELLLRKSIYIRCLCENKSQKAKILYLLIHRNSKIHLQIFYQHKIRGETSSSRISIHNMTEGYAKWKQSWNRSLFQILLLWYSTYLWMSRASIKIKITD